VAGAPESALSLSRGPEFRTWDIPIYGILSPHSSQTPQSAPASHQRSADDPHARFTRTIPAQQSNSRIAGNPTAVLDGNLSLAPEAETRYRNAVLIQRRLPSMVDDDCVHGPSGRHKFQTELF
jgi:hypothetical protein